MGHDSPASVRDVVAGFLADVRSGRRPDDARRYLASAVLCHQLASENAHEHTVRRTPSEYAAHIRELLARWGAFTIAVDELLVDGDRAYARWTQRGHDLEGPDPECLVTQITSATYRIDQGLIVEYWVQINRLGVNSQTADVPAAHATAVAPAGGLPRYRLLTGPDDETFCRRVSDALDLGFALHGSPASTFDGQRVVVAQAVVWPTPTDA